MISPYLSLFGEEFSLGRLLLLEQAIVKVLVELDAGDINLSRGGNNESLVDTLKWDTVSLVGTSDEEESGFELLQENNTLSTETTSQKDQDGTGSDGLAELGGARNLAALQWALSLSKDISLGGLGNDDVTGLAVLGSSNLDSLGSGGHLLLMY